MRMTLPAGLLLLAALAGCDRQSPGARAAPAAVRSPLDAVPDAPAPPITIKASFQCPKPAVEGEPILPLDAPLTEMQKLICAEPELALLDHKVHESYLAARLRSGVDRGRLSKAQTQWEADRDTCLKAADPRDCTAEASRTRLAELAMQDPATVARTQLQFTCRGTATPLTAAFYSRMRPAFAVLGFGRQQAIVFVQPTNAGLKYGRTGVDFFVLQGQVKAEFYGRTLACTSPSWRPSETPATVVAAQATDALVEQVASHVPAAPASLPPSATAKVPVAATATQPTDALVEQAAPQAPAPSFASAEAPATVAVAQTANAPPKQVASQTPVSSVPARSPAPAKASARVAAARATDALVRQVAPHAPASAPGPSSVPATAPATMTSARAAEGQAEQVARQAPTPTASVRTSRTKKARVNVAAAQATDALVRQVVMQTQSASAPASVTAPTAAESDAAPMEAKAEASAQPVPADAKP